MIVQRIFSIKLSAQKYKVYKLSGKQIRFKQSMCFSPWNILSYFRDQQVFSCSQSNNDFFLCRISPIKNLVKLNIDIHLLIFDY